MSGLVVPRVVLVWCPDWPVVAAAMAASVPVDTPVAVVHAQRVLACSAVARAAGVRRGLRRREAQARCPELVVLAADADRDARLFEAVAAAVEEVAPGVEVLRPGMVALAARGPTRYFGGEPAVAERLVDHVADRAGVECQVGIADGIFTAALAAHRGQVVPAGGGARFLAPLGIGELCRDPELDDTPDAPAARARAELVDLLARLGIATLGAFAALPAHSVASRFGADAVHAHRLAAGRVERPAARRTPPTDLIVTLEPDPPIERVDAAAFAARAAAVALTDRLAAHGLACTRLGIQAVVESVRGERTELARVWRCAEALDEAGTADRVRWQLEGWLTARSRDARDAGTRDGSHDDSRDGPIVALRLVPEEVVAAGTLQLGLWGETGESDARAGRVLTRVQTLLGGPETVVTAVPDGGRAVADRIRLVPWGEQRVPLRDPKLPWPGALPAPFPARVSLDQVEVRVLDAAGGTVEVTERDTLGAAPAVVCPVGPGRPDLPGPTDVVAWSGPWVSEERWWAADMPPAPSARLQVVLAGYPAGDGHPGAGGPGVGGPGVGGLGVGGLGVGGPGADGQSALLLVRRAARWWIEAVYD